MPVQLLGPYITPEPPKPYIGITQDTDALAALDALHRRIVAARDEMRLVAAKDEYESRCSGICVMVADDFAMFFRLENAKGMFLWSPLGSSAFGLRNVRPGESWSYRRGIWTRHAQTPSDVALWQSYWYTYPEVVTTPTRGKKKTDSGDSDAAAAAALNMKPAKPITPTDLASMGL